MTTPLRPNEITDRIKTLRSSLTTMQLARLTAISDIVDESGRFQLRQALIAGEFPEGDDRAQDAFRDFRNKVNEVAAAAEVDLILELESRKSTPDHRHGWFAGNPVEKSLVAYSEGKATVTDIVRPIAPEVRELGEPRPLRLYVSFHPPASRNAATLIEQLTTRLRLLSGPEWSVRDTSSVGLGEDTAQTHTQLLDEADVCVCLITPAYIDSPEREAVLSSSHKLAAVTFAGLPNFPVALKPLQQHEIALRGMPWEELRSPSARKVFIDEVIREILLIVRKPRDGFGHSELVRSPRRDDDPMTVLKAFTAAKAHILTGEDSAVLVPARLREAALQESLLASEGESPTGVSLSAIDRLTEWAMSEEPNAPRLCALLGDVGMGKTTTAKLFTTHLLVQHEKDPALPFPILFDLRDVQVSSLSGSMTLDRILNDMLDATRPIGVSPERLNADVVRERLEDRTVIVFDGLDEVLVHLSPHNRQLFTRQLWRALPAESNARMLLTCRTQYFRTIRDEADFFHGHTRQGLRSGDYLALLMLPFTNAQIREYLEGNLDRDTEWVDRFLDTIRAVHNLTELAQRPITLRLISDQVEFIENAKLEGTELRSVDIYAEVVNRWITRDEGKHTLTADHKRLLMEEIAAALWRSGKNAWDPAELDDWLLELLDQRPDLRRHYRQHVPDLWTADFRTATFLKREGDTFEFAHRSLFEYFLARYLFRQLNEGHLDPLAMPVPSRETVDFLGQSIAAAPDAACATLELIGRQYRPQVSELAVAYALQATRAGYPHQSLIGVNLVGAALAGWNFTGLSMAKANMCSADLSQVSFVDVNLTGADFTQADVSNAEFHKSLLAQSKWQSANIRGVIFRHCEITDADFDRSNAYRTQLLCCTPSPDLHADFQIAPSPEFSSGQPPSGAKLNYFSGPSGPVNVITWSPDHLRLLTGGNDNVAYVWDVATGQQLHRLTGHGSGINAIDCSLDNTRILTGSHDNTIRVWDATTGKQLLQLTGHHGHVRSVAWSPDNTRILTAGDDNTIRIWDATTGKQLHKLTGHDDEMNAVAWSPDNTRILTAGDDNTARVWDATTGKQLLQLTGHDDEVRSVAWSPDNTRILTGSHDNTIRVWDATTGKQLHKLTGHDDWVRSVAWSPDNTRILTAGDDNTIRVWDATTGKQLHKLSSSGDGVNAAVYSRANAHILTAGAARFWHAVAGQRPHQLAKHSNWINAVAWSPDNTRILTAGNDHTIRVWDATTGKQLLQLTGHDDWVRSVAWSPDNTRILTGSHGNTIRIWDATTGKQLHKLTGHDDEMNAVAWSPDNTRILTADDDNTIRVWDATTGKQLLQLTGHHGHVRSVAWSPDNTRILTAGHDNTIRIWDATTGKQLHKLTGHDDEMNAVAWSPDNTRILTAGDDNTARVWDATTGKQLLQLTGHDDEVRSVAWSPDNTRILTGSHDNTARVWDATTGKQLHKLTGHDDWVRSVAWSPDNTRILTGGDDGTARVWDATTGEPLAPFIVLLPGKDFAVFNRQRDKVIECGADAWRWIGWNVIDEHGIDRLPAETFGPLPVQRAQPSDSGKDSPP
ncbi:eIF2A-related protein [Lentzea sp. HUAS TT2]|uniref:WD40 domain-containing protein n=1 Tax=Lentzea sp. HUAS TT2 TaxID=3447454 RepID=UPI003F7074C0